MKVKELIEKLMKVNQDKEVEIRFSLDEDDEIGYILEPMIVTEIYKDEVGIYSKYTATKEDCNFTGQVDLKEAYKLIKEREEK